MADDEPSWEKPNLALLAEAKRHLGLMDTGDNEKMERLTLISMHSIELLMQEIAPEAHIPIIEPLVESEKENDRK